MEPGAFAVRRRGPAPPRAAARRRQLAYSADDVLDAIRRWAARYGEPPTMVDWDPARARRLGQEWRAERFEAGEWPSARVVRGRFPSFNAAVQRAGLPARPSPSRQRAHLADRSAVLEAIAEWVRRYGDVPTMADWDTARARRLGQDWRIARYNQGDWPSARTVVAHFGSLGAAVAEAGFAARPQGAPAGDRRTREVNRHAVAAMRAAQRPAGRQDLAETLNGLVAARSAGDPVAVHAALIEVAAAALAWADAVDC